ncbi:MAG: glycoside hydrolase family 16 protein [Treponema sp.]|jgi:beta-glucanase (GH16 family)|nr:glycoside hydrolase family 16 protein [Treponema sp.]
MERIFPEGRPVFLRFLAALGAAGFFLVPGCAEESRSPVPPDMALVWSDEFEGDGAPDPAKWEYALGGHGWGNAELQTYTNRRENSALRGGSLFITTRKEEGRWTSARLKTQYTASWTGGYFEIRARLPRGRGTWPAVWMLPRADRYGSWPRSGEIDIVEHVGHDQDRIHGTAHTGAWNHRKNTQKTASVMVRDVSSRFHVYALEWDSRYLQWYVDGRPFYRYDNPGGGVEVWPFDIPFYLVLNVAIGGSWGGQEGVDEDLREAVMEVDYVRVYQRRP